MGDRARPLAVVDIDGVVADVRHRLHHLRRRPRDWGAFFAAAPRDPVHLEGLAVVERLAVDHEVVFLTGRPEELREPTEAWLDAHGLAGHRVLMRPRGDRRPAAALKVERVAELRRDREVAVVVDDAEPVLAALRAAGVPTFAADWERRDAAEEAALQAAQQEQGRS